MMNPKDGQALISKGSPLLDIREIDELRESGIAEGAEWMPVSKISANHPDWEAFKAKTSKDTPILMYCRSGGRVSRLTEILKVEGYRVENLGGLKDWQAAGLPVKPFLG